MTTKVVILKSRIAHQGGLEKHALRLANGFAKRKCKVIILSCGHEEFKGQPFHVINLCPYRKLNASRLRRYDALCNQWLQEHGANVVFGMERTQNQTHYRAGNGVHAQYLKQRRLSDSLLKRASFAINPLHRTILSLERSCFESPSLKKLFTNSYMVRQEILNHYNTDPEKIETIHNGVEWREMQQDFDAWQDQRRTLLMQWGLNKDKYQLLFIGQGFRRKGLQFLLQGMSALNRQDIQLSVIGKDREAHKFQKMSQKLGLAQQVKFFGTRSDVHRFYQAADALAIPSIYDPFANVTVEAQAMGLFVISSKYNGGKEILNPKSGHVIENLDDADSVAESLKIAINHPKTALSAASIRKNTQHLDFSYQLDKVLTSTLN